MSGPKCLNHSFAQTVCTRQCQFSVHMQFVQRSHLHLRRQVAHQIEVNAAGCQIEELEVARIAILAKLEVTPPDARTETMGRASLKSFVQSYQNEISFGDPESKKAVMNTLIASALLDGDNLSLTPNYPGFTGV